jgi:hypothetical protein
MGKLGLHILLAALVSLTVGIPAPTPHTHEVRAPTASKNVIVQMFEWTWDSVAAECTSFLGPAGYGFVQGIFYIVLTLNDLTNLLLQSAQLKSISKEASGGRTINQFLIP